ncbi:hypothetical protein Tco_0180337 [Tanacetum coccineum]
MAGSEDDIPPPPPPPSQTPTQQTPHTVSTIKLPILKKGEYDIWAMKMEHYLAHTDYPIWEVIQRGNGPVSVSTDTNGLIKVLPPKTAEEILARERERKARTTLLMALPEDHLAKFHKMTDAKEMWEAIKSRFGGNDESKKMQKYILKQQFEGFSVSNSEGLHKGYDRFQSLLSQLEIHGAGVSRSGIIKNTIKVLLFHSYIHFVSSNQESQQNVRLKDTEHEEEGKGDAVMTDVGRDDGTQQTTYEQVKDDEHVILKTIHDTQKTEGTLQSSFISSDFANQFLNLDNAPPVDNEVVSMMNVKVRHEEPSTQTPSLLTIPIIVISETSTAAAPTIPPTIPPITPLPQQSTPTTKPTTTSIPALLDFSSLFRFNQRVSVLERDLSQLKQVDYSAQLLKIIKSQIHAMVDAQLSARLEDSIQKAFWSYTT